MTSLDNLTLMQWFVSGDATLEANQSLRIQPANTLRQLLGRKGSLLATAFDAAMPPRIEVRRHTDYTDVLHRILVDHYFVPIGQGLDSPVLRYAYYPIPEGYRIVYCPARQLWKQWWTHSSNLSERHLQTDLLALANQKWYPIRDITLNSATLYVETLQGETVHHSDDMMVWLEKASPEAIEETQMWTPPPQVDPAQTSRVQSSQAVAIAAVVDPTLAPVVYAIDDKIYVQTSVGMVVIEGKNLKAYSPTHLAQPVRQELPR